MTQLRILPRPIQPLAQIYLDAMHHLADGLSDDEIAERMGVAPITLRGWWRNVASMLPDAPPCPASLGHRRRVERYALALAWCATDTA